MNLSAHSARQKLKRSELRYSEKEADGVNEVRNTYPRRKLGFSLLSASFRKFYIESQSFFIRITLSTFCYDLFTIASHPALNAAFSVSVQFFWCSFLWNKITHDREWCSQQSGTCFRLMAAICMVNQFKCFRVFSSWILRMWCISTGVEPQIIQVLFRFDRVNLFAQLRSINDRARGCLIRYKWVRA